MSNTNESNSQYRWRIRQKLLKQNLPKGTVAYNNGRARVRILQILRPWIDDNNSYYTRDVVYSNSTIRLDAYVRVKYNVRGDEYNFLTIVYSRGVDDKYAMDCEFYYIDTETGNLTRVWYSDDNGEQVYITDHNYIWFEKIQHFVHTREQQVFALHCLSGVERISTINYFVPSNVEKLDCDVSVTNKYMEPLKRTAETKPRKRYRTQKRIAAGEIFDNSTSGEIRNEPESATNTQNKLPDIL